MADRTVPSSMLDHAGGQIVGRRAEQQDYYAGGEARLEDGRSAPVLVLADGMGGHRGGAVAASVAVEAFLDAAGAGSCRSYPALLRQALEAANRAIAGRAGDDPELAGMGCTLVAVIPESGRLHYVSVGDSLLLSVAGGEVERINEDHSMAPLIDRAVADGELTAEEARRHPLRSSLRSALTGSAIALVDHRTIAAGADRWILIASDGLLTIDPPRIARLVGERERAENIVKGLLEAVESERHPHQDNCTIIAFRAPAPVSPAGSA